MTVGGGRICKDTMRYLLFAAMLAFMICSQAEAAACLVKQWGFVYGQQTSAQMSAPSGAICQTYLDASGGRSGGVVRSIRISTPPRNGTATAQRNGITYRSASGYQGRDSFSFLIMGAGRGAQRLATVRMNVVVAATKGVPVPRSGPIKLRERLPWLVENRGPKKAVGVFYFVNGLTPDEPDDDRHRAPQYFLKSLSEAGWDVISAKYPQDLAYPGHEEAHKRVAEFVRDRVRELKEGGYRRVILGGQSWGAWTTMVAERGGDLAADGLFLMAPATYGAKTTQSGRPNLSFPLNRSEFEILLKSIEKPTAAVFFANDEYDPGGRAKLFEEHVRSRQLANVLIADPSGLKGHNAGWLPAFDYRYGACLQAFFETLASRRCEPAAAPVGDFRSIAQRSEIADGDAKRIASAEKLVGRSYVVYSTAGSAWKASYRTTQSVVLQTPKGQNEQAYEFKQGQHCRENQCRELLKWDDKHLIAFDPKSGAATSWWVELPVDRPD